MKLMTLVASSLLCAAGTAVAGVTTIPEFSGQQAEGFEGILPPGGYPSLPIFNGSGTMSNSFAPTVVIATSWFGPGGDLLAYNGNFFGGIPVGMTVFQFNNPIFDFGGQFATVEETGNASISFFDPQGELIDTLPLSVAPVQWEWCGWHSDDPIGRIEITNGSFPPGGAMQYDDLQINVPEPASFGGAGLAIGAAALRRRRRA